MNRLVALIFILFNIGIANAQKEPVDGLKDVVDHCLQENLSGLIDGKVPLSINVDEIPDDKRIVVDMDNVIEYYPIREELLDNIRQDIKKLLPRKYRRYDIEILLDGHDIYELIPNCYRAKRKQYDLSRLLYDIEPDISPWVNNLSRQYNPSRGLKNRYIALWQSHGRYYSSKSGKWLWQRPALFCTCEDLLTQSFVIPYIIPMLQNAGATVFTPRERDTQSHEVIVDNDDCGNYIEQNGVGRRWRSASKGFAYNKNCYADGDNPFEDGTFRYVKTRKRLRKAFVEWVPDIPEKGEYAVYVSYKSFPNSTEKARYSVFHYGGVTEFEVNQKIGGGTWVYLGTFTFDKGENNYGMVVLNNSGKNDEVVSADGVRFGGGMGNVTHAGIPVSDMPRYLEGARYYAQWSGMPQDVYGPHSGKNDYADDINTRSRMVNYMAGGSVYGAEKGLGIPFELTLGLHTDAGAKKDKDAIVGSLGIYTTDFNDGKLAAGTSRMASRDLIDMILTGIKSDIDLNFKTDWIRRPMWNRNYSETRLPDVPSVILELLSHQNFGDMKYALDPNFRFCVSRSIYKSILKYVAGQHNEKYVVQPLPVTHFAIDLLSSDNVAYLSWEPAYDVTERSSSPDGYIVYRRIGNGGFDNGTKVERNNFRIRLQEDIVYSFKVTAVNDGGESFPSEILSVFKSSREKGKILIINGFDRLSGPATVETCDSIGFVHWKDPGVPYLYDLSFMGFQKNFNPRNVGKEGPGGLGFCDDSYNGTIVAGNTFDYPFVHGKSMQNVGGYSFASASDEAYEDGNILGDSYDMIDYICGAEKYSEDYPQSNYKTFTPKMMSRLTDFISRGKSLLVSGAYIGRDMVYDKNEIDFMSNVLKCRMAGITSCDGHLYGTGTDFYVARTLNKYIYTTPTSDVLSPVGGSFSAMKYDDNESAAVAYDGAYKVFSMGFPFECITDVGKRNTVMNAIINFLMN